MKTPPSFPEMELLREDFDYGFEDTNLNPLKLELLKENFDLGFASSKTHPSETEILMKNYGCGYSNGRRHLQHQSWCGSLLNRCLYGPYHSEIFWGRRQFLSFAACC